MLLACADARNCRNAQAHVISFLPLDSTWELDDDLAAEEYKIARFRDLAKIPPSSQRKAPHRPLSKSFKPLEV